jgi:6-phosphogluconolactonase (cycloisomerase 2 family)
MPNYIYVSLQDEDKVLIFRLDSGTGKLTPQGALPLPGGPSAMAMSPDRKVLYVSHRNVPGISSYQTPPSP